MGGSFDPTDFVARVARRLVLEFADATQAGTPGLIGAAREHPARVQLGKMLPGFADVGSGLVIDSFGGISKQQDVVVYERHFCPVFTVNDTPEATYYPVEGVIGVGEIKSTLDGSKLEDAF